MKALKKATALFLSILMIFGMVSVSATAVLNDGNGNSFAVTSVFLRYDKDTDAWYETEKAARGDKVKVQLNIQTDFGAGYMDLLWAFSKGNLTFDTEAYKSATTNSYYDIYNTEEGSATGDYGYYGTITPVTKDYESGNYLVDWLVKDGYITEEFTQENGFLIHLIGIFYDTSIVAPKLTSDKWMYEYYFTVADDATGEGKLFLEPSTIQGPDEQDLAYFNIQRAKVEGVSNVMQTNEMYKWDTQPSATLNHGSITFDNTVTFDGNGGTVSGTSEYTGYIGETLSVIDGFAVPTASKDGQKFLGWATTKDATAPDVADAAAIEVDYEATTLYAVYEAAEASYVQNVYTMDTDGAYPEAPETSNIGAATGDKVKAEDYTVPAGFTLDADNSTAGEVEVTADGTAALNIYLKRNQYKATFGETSSDVYYEASYTAPEGPAKEGYTFAGWETKVGDETVVLKAGESATMGLADVTYTATYAPAANKATIVINYVDQVTGEAEKVNMEVPSTTDNTVAIVEEAPAEPAANTTYVTYDELTKIAHYEFTTEGSTLTATVAADGSTVLNVNYVPVKYTATFTGVENGTYTEDYYTVITVPAAPEKAGETFTGWLGSDGTTLAAGTTTFNLVGDVTYTAQYGATDYTITYVYDGAAPDGVTPPEAVTANMGDDVELPAVSAEGWTFNGWKVEGAVEANDAYTVGTSDVTVTGTWTKNVYTINFWLDDAMSVAYDSGEFSFGDEVDFYPATVTEEELKAKGINGFEFIKWDMDAVEVIDSGTVLDYFEEVETGKYVLNYTATLEEIEYAVTVYYSNVAGYENTDVVSELESPYYYGETIEASALAALEKVEGYTFNNWKQGATELTAESFPLTVTSDISLRGYFTVIQYPAVFDADGGAWLDENNEATITTKTVMVDYGAAITAPTDLPVRDGYTLDTEMVWDNELGLMMPDLTWDDEAGTWVADETPTYHAVWVPNEYTITFVVDDAETSSTYTYDDSKTIGEVSAIKVPGTDKEGYTFLGWSTDGTELTIVTDDIASEALPIGNTKYIAVYKADDDIAYTVETYTMGLDGEYGEADVTTAYGTSDTTVTITPETKEGFTVTDESVLSGTIVADGSLVLKVYYSRNQYTVDYTVDGEAYGTTETYYYGADVEMLAAPTKTGYTFSGWSETLTTMPANDVTISGTFTVNQYDAVFYVDGEVIATVPTNYGEIPVAPTATKAGYTFVEWSPALTAMGVDGAEYYAVFSANDGIAYTVETYTMGVDGEYGEAVVETKYGETDSTASIIPEMKEGFTVADESVLSGTIAADGSLVLKVYYSRDQYTVDYTVDGEAYGETETYYYGADVEMLAAPTKTGYTFSGWSETLTTMPANDVTISGTFTVNQYDAVFYVDGEVIATVPTNYGEIPVAPTATKEGYTFVAWSPALTAMGVDGAEYTAVFAAEDDIAYTVETYTMGVDGEYGEAVVETKYGTTGTEINYVPAEKTGFTLNAEMSTYDDGNITIAGDGSTVIKVYYDRNKVTVTIDGDKDEYYWGVEIDLPEVPEKEGETFDKWVDEDGNTVTDPYTVPYEEDGEIIITSVYAPNKYTVTFTADGNVYATGEFDYGSDIKAPEEPPVKSGYTFLGWSTDGATVLDDLGTVAIGGNTFQAVFKANEGISYTVNKVYQSIDGSDWLAPVAETRTATAGSTVTIDADAEAVKGFTVYEIDPASAEIAGDGSTVFYIYYQRNKVSVTINGEEDEYYYEETIEEPEDPTKDGYTFEGWEDEEGNPVEFPITVPAEDIVIKPVFTPNTVSISFVVDGETVEGYPVDATVDEEIAAPASPTKNGYTFAGWYVQGTSTAFSGKVPTSDTVYEAKWIAGDNTKYVIEIYIMNVNGVYEKTSVDAYGTTESTATIVPNESMEGFTVDYAQSVLSGTIAADESTVLKVYYARDLYEVTWDVDGVETTEQVYYGAAIVAPADPEKDGYDFTGWTPEVPATMPAEELTFEATWAAAEYTVTYVVNGTKTTETYAYGATVTVMAAPSVEGMTFNGWFDGETEYAAGSTFEMPAEDLIIVADFSTGIYTVTFLDATGAVFATEMVKFGDEIPVPADEPTKEHYTFMGWDIAYDTMPAQNITVSPIFERIAPKLIPMDGSTTVIDRDNYIITGLQEYLNESILRSTYLDVEGDGYFVIVPVAAGYYGTGAKVELYDNMDTSAPIETYTIVVYGDINGDSLVQAIDSTYADDEQLTKTNWSEEIVYNGSEWVANANYDPYKTMAADLNGDGIIDSTDATIIGDASIGIVRVNQVTGRTA